MKKRLWRLISILLIFAMGFSGPLGQVAYGAAYDALGYFEFDLGTTPYIEFNNTSPSAIDLEQAIGLKFVLEGITDTGVVNGDTDNRVQDFLETFGVMLTDVGAGGQVSLAQANGNLVNSNDVSVLEIALEVGQTIRNDTLYRIDFLTPTVRALINRVALSVYTDTLYDNVRFETTDGATVLSQNMAQFGPTSPAAITVREFTGDNILTLSGPTLSMDLGNVTDFGLANLEFIVEGIGQLSDTPTPSHAYLNGADSLMCGFQELNADPYVYSLAVPIDITPISGETTFAIELDDVGMQAYSTLIDQYINTNPSDGNVYVLGKDASGDVVAYNLLTSTNKELYVDPTFMFDGTTQPPFAGFYDMSVLPVLKYIYTGIPDTAGSGMLIDGVSSYDLDDGYGPHETPFSLTLYEDTYQDGDYTLDSMWFKELDGEVMNSGAEVPVNIFEDNTIVLSHDNQASSAIETTTFHWTPDATSIESFFEWAYIEEYQIGSDTDIHVITEPYSGNVGDLYLEIVELDYDNLIDGEPAQSKLERYEATYVESYYEEMSMSDKSRITFEHVNAEYMGLDAATDTYNLRANLVFENPALTSLGAVETLMNETLELDFMAPEPYNFQFDGVVDGVYYFVIGMNDKVDVAQLSANKDKFLDLFNKISDISSASIVSVEGYQDPYDTMPVTDGMYSMILVGVDTLLPPHTEMIFNGSVENQGSADLDFDYDASMEQIVIKSEGSGSGDLVFHVVETGGGDQYITKSYQAAAVQTDFSVDYFIEVAFDAYPIKVDAESLLTGSSFFAGIADANGNAMFETEFVELYMETQINSMLLDADGNYLLNANLSLIPVSDIPEPTSGSAITWENVYNLSSDADGMIYGSVYPGSYLAFELTEKDAEGVKEDRSIDLNLAFPVRSSFDPYMDPIQLPADNVSGNSLRSGTVYEEDIIFIKSEYLDDLQAAMADMSNWELFDVLDMFYIKEVTTETDG